MKRFSVRKNIVFCSVGAAVIVVIAVATVLTGIFSQKISDFFNQETSRLVNAGEPIYTSSFSSPAKVKIHDEAVCRDIEAEGMVLLENNVTQSGERSLPLARESHITVLGRASADLLYASTDEDSDSVKEPVSLYRALEESGFYVNPVMTEFYETGAGKKYDRVVPRDVYEVSVGDLQIGEVPGREYTSWLVADFADYSDAAIVVVSRSATEGYDIPMEKDENGRYYLQLDKNELDLLKLARENFPNVVLLVNSSHPIMLGEAEEEGCMPDSVLWIGNPGSTGTLAIGRVLNGYTSPSGRLTETWAYDHTSAPSSVSLRRSEYIWDGAGVSPRYADRYTVLSEGIYVGYRYYETRYEDYAMHTGNPGEYDYSSAVMYPFGSGLSYTSFGYSDFGVTRNEEDDCYDITVTVTNTGSMPGKEVVQIYMRAPYTEHDIAAGIERPAVELVGYAKTTELQPQSAGEEAVCSETLTISVESEALEVFDAGALGGAGGYVTEGGTYYFTAASDAHDAVNNILAYRQSLGQIVPDPERLVGYDASNISLTAGVEIAAAAADEDSPERSRLAFADIRTYDDGFTYLTRSDWAGTLPSVPYAGGYWLPDGEYAEMVVPSSASGDEQNAAENDAASDSTDLTAFDLIGAHYGDERFTRLAEMLSQSEKTDFLRMGGYTINALAAPAMPGARCRDGLTGISTDVLSYSPETSYPSPGVVAATWNDGLARTLGECFSEDSLASGVSGVFSPCLNIRRNSFVGENDRSFGEDPLLAGRMGAAEVRGIRTKMGIAFIGDFALYVQSSAVTGLSVFADEQTIRSIYLRPFEIAVKDGGATAAIQSASRIGPVWVGASRQLMTDILRGEWDFGGMTLTARGGNDIYMNITDGLLAGTDMWFNDNYAAFLPSGGTSSEMSEALTRAVSNVMYAVISSNAMNGITADTRIEPVLPPWQVAYIILASVLLAGAVALFVIVLVNRIATRRVASTTTEWTK